MASKHNRENSTTELPEQQHPHSFKPLNTNPATIPCSNHKFDLQPIRDISYIGYGIFIGSYRAACKPFLLRNHITHVLSIGWDPDDELSPEITVKKIELKDDEDAKIGNILDEACQFIKEGTEGNNKVLVHCKVGLSRSPAVVIHYLHRIKHFPMYRAFFFVAFQRPIIDINPGFKNEIIEVSMKENSKIKREHFNIPVGNFDYALSYKRKRRYLEKTMETLKEETDELLKPPKAARKGKRKIKFHPSKDV